MSSPSAILALLLSAWFVVPLGTAAQQPSDSARAQALRDFHGPDLEGKDGPLAKAGLDLLTLYYRHQQAENEADFSPEQSGLQVQDGRVAIDAVAATDVQALRDALEALGLEGGAAAGRVVSGRFPIEHIPELAQVKPLRGVMPSRAQTHGGGQQPSPSPVLGDDSEPSTDPDDTAPDDTAPDDPAPDAAPSDSGRAAAPPPPPDDASQEAPSAESRSVKPTDTEGPSGNGVLFLLLLAVLILLFDEEANPIA